MTFIDTHAHLYDERLATELFGVLDRAHAEGVSHIVNVGIDRASSTIVLKQCQDHSMLVAAVGIQPNHVAEAEATDWDEIVRQASSETVVAIGETGLDRYWDRSPFALQEDYFARHLELAHQLNKAVVIHCREAEEDVVRMLRDRFDRHGPVRGVMHSYCGDAASAEQCLAMGLHVSFAGMLTYKTGEAIRDVAKVIPDNRLLIETDCPYLAPVPVRGKRNEPAFVVHTAKCLAAIRGVSLDVLGAQTTANACDLFGLSVP